MNDDLKNKLDVLKKQNAEIIEREALERQIRYEQSKLNERDRSPFAKIIFGILKGLNEFLFGKPKR